MKTTWNPTLIAAFEAVFRPWMRRRLAGCHVRGSIDELPRDRRVILAANHVSWWDGFLLRELHRSAGTSAPLYTLMRSDQAARFPFFMRMGVVGLTEEPHAVRAAVRRLQSDPSPFWVSFFPQGRIWPSWKRPLDFRRGVEVFARELAPCAVVPVGLHLEPLTEPSPAAFVGLGDAFRVEPGERLDVGAVETRVARVLDELMDVLAVRGEEAAVAWTSPETSSECTT